MQLQTLEPDPGNAGVAEHTYVLRLSHMYQHVAFVLTGLRNPQREVIPVSENMKKTRNTNTNIHALIEAGLFIALAFILSYLRLWRMPQGGSVTLASMLPIILIGLRWGPKWGLGAGFVYGLLQFLQDGYALTPVNVIMDYILAFGALGLAGFFRRGKYRLLHCHGGGRAGCVLSSTFCPASFSTRPTRPKGQPVWLYSLIYNGPFLAVDMLIVLVAGGLLIHLVPQLKPLMND